MQGKVCRVDTAYMQWGSLGSSSASPTTCSVSPKTYKSISTEASSVATASKTDVIVRKYREARESHEKVRDFLTYHGYDDVNSVRRRLLKSSYPLHCAVQHNDALMVGLLLAWGADPTKADSAGKTPLDQAEKRNWRDSHSEVIRLLQDAANSDRVQRPGSAYCPNGLGLAPGLPASHGGRWESFLKQLAKDPLVSQKRLTAIAPHVAF